MLADYRELMGKPFEHETRLKERLTRQADLNAALDLDKGERQIAPPAEPDAGPESKEGGSVEEGTSGPLQSRERYNGIRHHVPRADDVNSNDEKILAPKSFRPTPGQKM
jgi:hypothetical protein